MGLTGERKESGRGNPMTATIRAETRLDNGKKLEDEVSIEQIEGDPAYNVIRQEYEDVKVSDPSQIVSGHDDARTIDLPAKNQFTIFSSSLPQSQGEDKLPDSRTGYESYVISSKVTNGMRNAALQALQTIGFLCPDGDQELDTFKECMTSGEFYQVNSHFRNPVHNDSVGGKAISRHLIGLAVDFDVGKDQGSGSVQPYNLLYPRWANRISPKKAFIRWMRNHGNVDSVAPDYPGHVHLGWPRF